MPVSSSSCDEFLRRAQLVVGGGLAVDGSGQRLVDRATLVDGIAQHVHDAAQAQRRLAHGHGDRGAGVADHQAAADAVRRTQCDGAHDAVAELLLHFQCQRRAFELEGVIDAGHGVARKLHVDHRADALDDLALCLSASHFSCPSNWIR